MQQAQATEAAVGLSPTVPTKKGYSIWSLLVIMTLLAVWWAVPRRSTLSTIGNSTNALFFLSHQLGCWGLVTTLVWLVSHKRRSVLIIAALLVFVVWGPLMLITAEEFARWSNQHPLAQSLLSYLGLYDGYALIYAYLYMMLGYGSPN